VDFEKDFGKGTERRQVANFDDADRLSSFENVTHRNFKSPWRVEGISDDVKAGTTSARRFWNKQKPMPGGKINPGAENGIET